MRPQQEEVHYFLAGAFYRMSYTVSGRTDRPALVCVHGLTRNGRDFGPLARALADSFRVYCPDLPGRGESDWLPDAALYQLPSYVTALTHLLARIGAPVSFLGTSLGGLCGMAIAGASRHPVQRLVLNDVGPAIPAAAIRRIRGYMMGVRPEFPNLEALEAYLRDVHSDFGDLTDRQWRFLAESSARPLPEGRVALHYDPGIAQPIRTTLAIDSENWALWDRIDVPVLVLRGERSDLLLPSTAERMRRSGALLHEVAGCGHAPALMDAATIGVVRDFLLDEEASRVAAQ